jgi:hypothetical protein
MCGQLELENRGGPTHTASGGLPLIRQKQAAGSDPGKRALCRAPGPNALIPVALTAGHFAAPIPVYLTPCAFVR